MEPEPNYAVVAVLSSVISGLSLLALKLVEALGAKLRGKNGNGVTYANLLQAAEANREAMRREMNDLKNEMRSEREKFSDKMQTRFDGQNDDMRKVRNGIGAIHTELKALREKVGALG